MAKMMKKAKLAKLYGISYTTLYRWFKRNSRLRHIAESASLISPKDLELIREELGDWEDA